MHQNDQQPPSPVDTIDLDRLAPGLQASLWLLAGIAKVLQDHWPEVVKAIHDAQKTEGV
jgi:hypothetical protein